MPQPLNQPGTPFDACGPESTDGPAKPASLVDSAGLKLKRIVLAAGKSLPDHRAPGDIVVHCLAGRMEFTSLGNTVILESGQLLYLPAGEMHSVHAVLDTVFLLTIGLAVGK